MIKQVCPNKYEYAVLNFFLGLYDYCLTEITHSKLNIKI